MATNDEEKAIPGRKASDDTLIPGTVQAHRGDVQPLPDMDDKRNCLLNAEEALKEARQSPAKALNIRLTYSINDPDNPRNWPAWKRWYIGCYTSWLNVLTCWCAGSFSSASESIAKEFRVSSEVTTLGLSLYILGFAIGPMLLAPLSEHFGRRPVYVCSWFICFIFQLPIALAPNIGTILVCRLIAGFGGSAPLTNTGGTISDLFKRNESGGIMAVYGLSSTFGPFGTLVILSYISQNCGWRALFWALFGITGGFWCLLVLTVPETRHSIILKRKVKKLRKIMAQENLKTAESIVTIHADEEKTLVQAFKVILTRPIRFLFTEPITFFAAAYNGFLYGIVYLFNEAFPLVFGPGGHNFNIGEQGLAFLGLTLGPIIAFCFYPLQERYYLKRVAQNDGKGVPEARVWMARLGAVFVPVSLFCKLSNTLVVVRLILDRVCLD